LDEKITLRRDVDCTILEKKVSQELRFLKIKNLGSLITQNRLVSTFCTGYPECNVQDCQLVVGWSGKIYSKKIDEQVDIAVVDN